MRVECVSAARRRRAVLEGRPFNHLVDVWSVGVITFILLGGYAPFHASDVHQLFTKIRKCDLHFNPKYWDKISDDAKDFIKQMLTRDPARRADAAQARRRARRARAARRFLLNPAFAPLANAAQLLSHEWLNHAHTTLKDRDISHSLPEMAGWHARRRSVSADVRRPGEKRQSGKELTYDHDRDVTKSPKSEARELEKPGGGDPSEAGGGGIDPSDL